MPPARPGAPRRAPRAPALLRAASTPRLLLPLLLLLLLLLLTPPPPAAAHAHGHGHGHGHGHDHGHDHGHGHDHAHGTCCVRDVGDARADHVHAPGDSLPHPHPHPHPPAAQEGGLVAPQEPHAHAVAPAAAAGVMKLTPAEQWAAAMVSNLVVTLFALSGALLMPFLRRKKSDVGPALVTFAVSLAVGSLLGDAILHLIPEALGVHSHGAGVAADDEAHHAYLHANNIPGHDHDHGHDHGHDDHSRQFWISCVTFFGAYSFFVIEKVLHHVMAVRARRDADRPDKSQPGGIKPIVWLILAGDGLHNFVDGLAIAVAFMKSWEGGLQTFLAVLLHEIPHELGDFAVLLSSGLPLWKALFFNCLGNAPAFLGSIIALTALPNSEPAMDWILAYTAGNFLYIALVDLLPSLFGGDCLGHGHDHHGSHDHTHHHEDGHMHGHPVPDTHSSTRTAPEKATAGSADGRDIEAVALRVEPSTCPAAHMSGEGIFRESTKDKRSTMVAVHLGILAGFGAMVGLALLEAAQH